MISLVHLNFINPLTGAGAYKCPEVVVCLKNHKKCPERAMLYLSKLVDRERVAEPRGIFFQSQKVQVARSYAPLKLIDFLLLTMATRSSLVG